MLHNILLPKTVTDSFITSNLDSLIVLKACGFIESHQARILAVSDGFLKLRVGHGSLTRFFFECPVSYKPIEITLKIHNEIKPEEIESGKYNNPPQVKHSAIDVAIKPDAIDWGYQEFQDAARKVLWSLRYHFMAC